MTIREAIKQAPQLEGESQRAYAKRLAALTGYTFNAVRSRMQEISRMQTVKQTVKDGVIISEVQKLVKPEIEVPDNFEIKRISTNTNTQQQWVIAEPTKARQITVDEIKECLKEFDFSKVKKVYSKPKVVKSDVILRVIITDVHVGMETNSDGYGLYGEVWNELKLNERLQRIVEVISQFALRNLYKEIHIINLGDFMDGWDGQTVRKGHNLPQNMDNKKAFKVGVNFLVDLYRELMQYRIPIQVHSVTNSNHSNDFDFIVNYAAKEILKAQYSKVGFHIYQRFISHYIAGNHCFILSHGKDAKNLKFGFKPILDANQKQKINEYISHHNLQKYFITFEKGDTHVQLIDSMSFENCDYNNYLALSPASEWVQTNFSKGRSGFNIMEVNLKDNIKTLTPIYFKWTKHANEYGS
jgi:hypothetical protein